MLEPGSYTVTDGWTQRDHGGYEPLEQTCTMPLDLVTGQVVWLDVKLYEKRDCTLEVGQEPG